MGRYILSHMLRAKVSSDNVLEVGRKVVKEEVRRANVSRRSVTGHIRHEPIEP